MKALRPAAWGFLLPAPRFRVRVSRARGARFLVAIVVVLVCSRVSCDELFCPARGLVFLWWCGGFLVAVKWHVKRREEAGEV